MRSCTCDFSDLPHSILVSARVGASFNLANLIDDCSHADIEVVTETQVVCNAVETFDGSHFADKVAILRRDTSNREEADGEEDLKKRRSRSVVYRNSSMHKMLTTTRGSAGHWRKKPIGDGHQGHE